MEGLGHAMDPHLCRPSEELAYAMQIVRERLRGIVRLERSFVSPLLRDDVVLRVANGLGERVRETPGSRRTRFCVALRSSTTSVRRPTTV
jgi:hypothetical protein